MENTYKTLSPKSWKDVLCSMLFEQAILSILDLLEVDLSIKYKEFFSGSLLSFTNWAEIWPLAFFK